MCVCVCVHLFAFWPYLQCHEIFLLADDKQHKNRDPKKNSPFPNSLVHLGPVNPDGEVRSHAGVPTRTVTQERCAGCPDSRGHATHSWWGPVGSTSFEMLLPVPGLLFPLRKRAVRQPLWCQVLCKFQAVKGLTASLSSTPFFKECLQLADF